MGHVHTAITAMVLFCLGLSTPCLALVKLSDTELEVVGARTGVAITFDNLQISQQMEATTFFPDEAALPQTWFQAGDQETTLGLSGTLTVEAGTYTSPQGHYVVQDYRKEYHNGLSTMDNYYQHMVDRGELTDYNEGAYINVYQEFAFDQSSDADAKNLAVVQLGITGFDSAPFTQVSSEANLGFHFDAMPDDMELTQGVMASGQLGISNINLWEQQITLYPHGDIPGHVSGEGIAFEIRQKTSVDALTISDNNGTQLFKLSGIHLAESFDQSIHQTYGRWGDIGDGPGTFTESGATLSEYATTTFDPDGFYGNDPVGVSSTIPSELLTGPVDADSSPHLDIYGGYFLMGNMNQIEFADRTSGDTNFDMYHAQRTDGDSINHIVQTNSQNGDSQLTKQAHIDAIAITERPATLGVRSGRWYWRYSQETNKLEKTWDDSTFIAINLPIHGSIRIEEVQGYDSNTENPSPLGTSMGPVILDGIRVKKLYIEFPGRDEQYTITQQNNHTYVYDAGRLPDGLNINGIPDSQPEWDPIGQGQDTFLSRLGPADANDLPTGRWDMYTTQIEVPDFGTKSYWRAYEVDYPASPNWQDDGRIVPLP